MNRIILIGNGFDLAHGLKTGYRDFMDWYWKNFAQNIVDDFFAIYSPMDKIAMYEDGFAKFEKVKEPKSLYKEKCLPANEENRYVNILAGYKLHDINEMFAKVNSYDTFKRSVEYINKTFYLEFELSFTNDFWKHISEQTACLTNWIDIENEYYALLKDFLKESRRYAAKWPTVKKLNEEFYEVKNLLEEYLTEVCKNNEVKPMEHILTNIICAGIKYEDVAIAKRKMFLDSIKDHKNHMLSLLPNAPEQFDHLKRLSKQELNEQIEQSIRKSGVDVQHTLLLNFNYTDTVVKLFGKPDKECDYEDYRGVVRPLTDVINIHGELNNTENPTIFGYGDELDEDYKAIENTNDPDFLDNIKPIHYLKTNNYRRLLDFLQDNPYQVFILGHSCGNSDRTLLNTIFEHPNCLSIKPFYHQWQDEETGKTEDNYTEITKNIYRNFNNKQNLRDLVVNRKHCQSLVP